MTRARNFRRQRSPWSCLGALGRWVLVLLILLPLCVISTLALLRVLGAPGLREEFGVAGDLQWLTLGAAAWLLVFWLLPRPTILYVFGHELTHAIWAMLMGGRIRGFKVGSRGGQVLSTKDNVLISLSPYFFPIYSIIVVIGYAFLRHVSDLPGLRMGFLFLLGATWSFHLTFTVVTIRQGQSDLQRHGNVFSLLLIYLVNLVVLAILLAIFSVRVTFAGLGREWFAGAQQIAEWFLSQVR